MKLLGRFDVDVAKIDVGQRLRPLDQAHVEFLEAQIRELGVLLAPLVLTEKPGGRFDLRAGGHRLAAIKRIGWSKVNADVYQANQDEALLAEIDENLRHELNPLDRAVFLAKRKEIYERLHPEAKRGGNKNVLKSKASDQTEMISVWSFAKDTAERVGLTERAIRLAVMIAERLPAEVRSMLAGTAIARKQADLLALAKLSPAQQQRALKLLLTDAPKVKSVRQAILQVTGRREKSGPSGFDRLMTAWRHATPAERSRFLGEINKERKPKLKVVA